MTSGQKIAFSLLAALALFAVFVMSLNSRLFTELETRFYAQAKIEENTGQLDKISESCDLYISEILSLIEKGDNAWVKNASVRSYYVQNPSESDVNTRRRLTESLFSDIPALQGIRIVDKNGRNVHYSSFDDTDLLKQSGITKVYKNYNDIIKDAGEIPFETLQKITSETKAMLLCDESRSRLIISVPFCWVDGIYSGLALFYLNMHEIEKTLITREVISLGQSLTLYSDDDYNGGLLLNLPHGKKNDFRLPVLNYWKTRSGQQPEKLLAIPDGGFYLGLSSNRIGKIRVSAVYTSDIFELSTELRILIYICIFISILLIVFLIFSFFRDPMVTLKKRIKKIQLEIIENYIDGKEKREWGEVARHLRVRRNDLSDDIIKSLHVHSKKRRKELSDYLDKNWDEIFAIFDTKVGESSGTAPQTGAVTASAGPAELTGASIAEIRRMLEEVLANRNIVAPVAVGAVAGATVAAAGAASAVKKAQPAVQEEADDVDELDEVEELVEDVDELDEVEELAEDVDELDDAEEIEELAEEADEVDEVEELAEDVGELDEAEEVEELAEDVDEIDDAEEVVEELTDEEPAEEAAEEEIEDLSDAEEPVDELDEVEDLDEEVEDLDEAVDELDEPVEELEGDDELEVLESAEDEIDAMIKSMAPPPKNYVPSNETYFATEKFATVENLYAEELKLGNFTSYFKKGALPIEIKIYPLPAYEAEEAEPEEDLIEDTIEDTIEDVIEETPIEETAVEETPVEDLTEEVPDYLPEPDFSMTSFGENLSDDLPELQEEKVIVEQDDGVFSIAEDIKYTDIIQDADFKSLVDSVL